MIIFLSVLVLVILILLITNIKIVPQSMVFVVERLGSYYQTWDNGVHFKVPFVDHIAKRVSLKEQVVDFKPQPVITRDNVTMQIDSVVFYEITDAKLFTYGVERPISAIENLTATTLRNIIGELELDHTLTSRDVINTKITTTLDTATDKWGIKVNRVELATTLRNIIGELELDHTLTSRDVINTKITTTLDTATDKWGIKVNRVELKNILPPAEIQDAMEKQMKAERQRRESILRAEGQKRSQVLIAEGEKEAAILKAQAEKESAILRADAVREQKIREADGEATAILKVQQAYADSLKMLNDAAPTDKVLTLKSFEALAKVAAAKHHR